MRTNTESFGTTSVNARTGMLIQCLSAAFFGLCIVGVVGFSHIEILHNAAHDVRHANGFPCH